MVGDLPGDFPAAMLVVHHFPAQSSSAPPNILSRATVLPAAPAADDDQIVPGHIYVARPLEIIAPTLVELVGSGDPR
jgi:chemotaxis response regulator CheB